jgi:hypothetical protein
MTELEQRLLGELEQLERQRSDEREAILTALEVISKQQREISQALREMSQQQAEILKALSRESGGDEIEKSLKPLLDEFLAQLLQQQKEDRELVLKELQLMAKEVLR